MSHPYSGQTRIEADNLHLYPGSSWPLKAETIARGPARHRDRLQYRFHIVYRLQPSAFTADTPTEYGIIG